VVWSGFSQRSARTVPKERSKSSTLKKDFVRFYQAERLSAGTLKVSQLTTQKLWSGLVLVSDLPDMYWGETRVERFHRMSSSDLKEQDACLPVLLC
jgi:hypothetical protein